MEAPAIWEAASARISDELGWVRTHRWLGGVRMRSAARGAVRLEADSAETRSAAREHMETIRAVLADLLGRPVQVRITHARGAEGDAAERSAAAAAQAASGASSRSADDDLPLEPERVDRKQDLSSFFAGPSNTLPLGFARQVVEAPGTWQPLVFYGATGSGKTHLLAGIVNGYRRRFPARRAVYSSGERFSSHFVQTRRFRKTERFRRLYREADLLVLDDLDGIAGRVGTEQELCRTLDHFQLTGRQVVVACATSPKRMPNLERGLEGRLLGGQVVKLEPADPETRRAIVCARNAASRLDLDEGVVDLLSAGFEMDVRELNAALTRLEAHQRHVEANLDLDGVRRILRDLLQGKLREASLDSVTGFVADRLATSADVLRGRCRKPQAVRARLIAMGLARELTSMTLREVGVFFGERSCASVHAAQARAQQLLEVDPQVREVWQAARRTFARPPR